MKYFFALGTHPKLSISELEAVLNRLGFTFKIIFSAIDILVIETTKVLPENFLSNLGGTIKFGLIEVENISEVDFNKNIIKLLQKLSGDKLYLGLSFYNSSINSNKIKNLGLSIKKHAKESGVNLRFVESRDNPLSSVIVKKNKLLNANGAEVVFISQAGKYLLGRTLEVQDFREYSIIDFGRPGRDDFSGMLPPKLAQIMINLAAVPSNATIYDPFCGSGTILQMAALLGYKNIEGSDISLKAIRDTEKNITWLKEKKDIKSRIHLFLADATQLSLAKNSIDAIVTEPFLGPPLRGNESASKINEIIDDLEPLYQSALKQFSKILKPNGCLILIIPEFKFLNHELKLNLEFPSELKKISDWQYSRPNQKVLRHIYKFIKK